MTLARRIEDFVFDNILLIGIALVVVGFILMGIGFKLESDRENYLMQQCMEDGKKEYECAAIARQATTVIPVVIYGGR